MVDPASGKRVQHSKGGFRTKGEAESHLNSVVAKVQDGIWRLDTTLTVRHLFEQWHAAKSSEALRPGTVKMYADVIDGWLLPNIGGLKVAQLSLSTAAELVAALRSPDGSRFGRGASRTEASSMPSRC